jgi:hypothetical protein
MMYLQSSQPAPSPSVWYSITHAHRPIGYRNRNPQPLTSSAAGLMYLRVYDILYDNRDISFHSESSPSVSYSITLAHITLPTTSMLLTITYTHVLSFLIRLVRSTTSSCETTRDNLTVCLLATQCMWGVLDPSVSTFSLSLYRHPSIYILFSSRFPFLK